MELEEFVRNFASSTDERFDDLFEQHVDHHLALRDITLLLEETIHKTVQLQNSELYDSKLEQLEYTLLQHEAKFKQYQYKLDNAQPIEDIVKKYFAKLNMLEQTVNSAELQEKLLDFKRYYNKLEQFEIKLSLHGAKLKQYQSDGEIIRKYEEKFKRLEKTIEEQEIKFKSLTNKLNEYESEFIDFKNKLKRYERIDQEIESLKSKDKTNQRLIQENASKLMGVSETCNILKIKIKECQTKREQENNNKNVDRKFQNFVTLTQHNSFSSQIDNKIKNLLIELSDLKNQAGSRARTQNEVQTNSSTNRSYGMLGGSGSSSFISESHPWGSFGGFSSPVYTSRFGSSGSGVTSTHNTNWVCRMCGRQCKARIGLYSHEKKCFKEAGRPFDG